MTAFHGIRSNSYIWHQKKNSFPATQSVFFCFLSFFLSSSSGSKKGEGETLFAKHHHCFCCVAGYLRLFTQTLTEELDRLPGDARTQIGFLCFDSSLYFFNLSEGLSQPQMMVVPDLEGEWESVPAHTELCNTATDCTYIWRGGMGGGCTQAHLSGASWGSCSNVSLMRALLFMKNVLSGVFLSICFLFIVVPSSSVA